MKKKKKKTNLREKRRMTIGMMMMMMRVITVLKMKKETNTNMNVKGLRPGISSLMINKKLKLNNKNRNSKINTLKLINKKNI